MVPAPGSRNLLEKKTLRWHQDHEIGEQQHNDGT